MSIVKNGKYYFYDFVHEGKRYRKSYRTTDKKLAEQVEISVKNDIIKRENGYNMSKAARTLGNTKQFISLLAKKFGIKKPEVQKG